MTKAGIGRAMLGGLMATAMLAGVFAPADASDRVTEKMKKQIGVVERVFDEVLVDSPNFLVGSRRVTHGLYLDGFGALFSFEASLISKDHDFKFDFGDLSKNFTIEREDGKIIVRFDEDEGDEGNGDREDEVVLDEDEWREKREEEQRELYEAGKAELAEALLDYGETLTTLGGDEWVAVAAFLRDSDFFASNKISTLVLKAKIGDLRAFAQGEISEKAMIDRVVEEEY